MCPRNSEMSIAFPELRKSVSCPRNSRNSRNSSAGGHAGLRKDPLLSGALESRGKVKNWAEWLRAGEDAALVATIRANTRTGRAASGKAFLARIEKLTSRPLRPRKAARPRKATGKPKK